MTEYPIWITDSIIEALNRVGDPPKVGSSKAKADGPQQRRIMEYVKTHDGATTFDVAGAIGRDARTALTYLARLVEHGKLRKEPGRPNRWWLA